MTASGNLRRTPVELDQERGAFVYEGEPHPWVDPEGRIPPLVQLQEWVEEVNARVKGKRLRAKSK